MQKGLKTAISVPLKVMNLANDCWDAMVKMAAVGNIATISDMQVSFFKYFEQISFKLYSSHSHVHTFNREIFDHGGCW